MDVTIRALSSGNIDDFLQFFDNIVFHEHPNWSVCYCHSFHFVGTAAEWNDKDKNRSASIRLIGEDRMHGYLAYTNGIPVGWCNADDKGSFQRLKLNKGLWNPVDAKARICSIVCFLIDPALRRKGIASRLLQRVCSDYASRGYDYVEGYPLKNKSSDEDQCQGPPSMYEKADFQVVGDFDEFLMVRKNLGNADGFVRSL